METSIKDLILSDETVIEARHKPKKGVRKPACYEVVTVSGPDFAVRKKGIKNSSLLVCICSKGQFYVKNESSGEHEPLDAQGLMRFLGDAPKDSGLELSDKDGNTPFWIRTLERTKDFSENFMAAVGDETLRQYFCRNMLSFSGISDCIEQDRKKKYYRPCCSNLKNLDFKRAKLVFESAAEHYPREELKEGMAEFLEQKNSGKKIGSMFQIMLRTAEQHSHHFRWRNTRTVYDWLFDNWGVEGVKQFIRTYLETPVSYMADAFESSINIQQTSFSLAEFLDYCFCECTRQGYAENPGNFIQSWEDYLGMQLQVYGKIQKKYSEYLASEEIALGYKLAKLREAEQVSHFSLASRRMRLYEGKAGRYMVIAPNTPRDMIEEGQMMSNCVASYIERVAAGETMVFFMRTRKDPDKSLVTIEVRNGRLQQVKGRFNKRPTEEQMDAVNLWYRNAFLRPKQVSLLEYEG